MRAHPAASFCQHWPSADATCKTSWKHSQLLQTNSTTAPVAASLPRLAAQYPADLPAFACLQHPPNHPGLPFHLYEQVFVPNSFGLNHLSRVPRDLQEHHGTVVMDAGWNFSCAHRLRFFNTNLRGHCRHVSLRCHQRNLSELRCSAILSCYVVEHAHLRMRQSAGSGKRLCTYPTMCTGLLSQAAAHCARPPACKCLSRQDDVL